MHIQGHLLSISSIMATSAIGGGCNNSWYNHGSVFKICAKLLSLERDLADDHVLLSQARDYPRIHNLLPEAGPHHQLLEFYMRLPGTTWKGGE